MGYYDEYGRLCLTCDIFNTIICLHMPIKPRILWNRQMGFKININNLTTCEKEDKTHLKHIS